MLNVLKSGPKLSSNETNQLCATEFHVDIPYNNGGGNKSISFGLPVPKESVEADSPVILDQVSGVYHVYNERREDHQLNWHDKGHIAIRDGEQEPADTEYSQYTKMLTIEVVGLEHNGISVTKNGTVNIVQQYDRNGR